MLSFNYLKTNMKVNFRGRKVQLNLGNKGTDSTNAQRARTGDHLTNQASFLSKSRQERLNMDSSKESYIDSLVDTIHLIGQEYVEHLNEGKEERFRAALLSSLTNLEARDRKIIYEYQFRVDSSGRASFDFAKEEDQFREWLGEMHFKIVSTSFDYLINEYLTYDEVKVYCSENLLLNLILFVSKVEHRLLGKTLGQLMMYINETLRLNLEYLLVKYPQAKEMKPNKKLRAEVEPINNLGNDINDMFQHSGIRFHLNDDKNYNSEIMAFINYLIETMSEDVSINVEGADKKNIMFAEGFTQIMEDIFQITMKPQAGTHSDKDLKEYMEKVSKYTSWKIGTKINPNTELFSKTDIKAGMFEVKSTSILRILTKWIEELEKKIFKAKTEILKRSFRFKNNSKDKDKNTSKLNASQKNDLFIEAQKKVNDLKECVKNIQSNAFSIEGELALTIQRSKDNLNIPKNEYLVGDFSSKLEDAASSSLLSYLNEIVHVLLQIPENARKKYEKDEALFQEMDINLITFKISDLLRCKCHSHQSEILRIYRGLRDYCNKDDSLMKIVRIKDRLEMGTRDILINTLYCGKFLCQIQLAITEEVDKKQQAYDAFNHYLYELKRSNLGPVMESACIWAHIDQRSRAFKKNKEHEYSEYFQSGSVKIVNHNCPKHMIENTLPFVCSRCNQFYFSQHGLIRHEKCAQCGTYFECSLCRESRMDETSLKSFLGMDATLGVFLNDFEQWYGGNIPKNGLIIPKKNRRVEISFFTTTVWKEDAYLVRSMECYKNGRFTTEIEIIASVKGNELKSWNLLKENYLIYEWKEKRFFNRTVKPANLKRQLQLQEDKRKQQEERRRKEREHELEQIKKKWEKMYKDTGKKDHHEDKRKGKHKDRPSSSSSINSKDSHISGKRKKEGKKKGERHDRNAYPPAIEQRQVNYNENISKKSKVNAFRVSEKVEENEEVRKVDYLVLDPYIAEEQIRKFLRKLSNEKVIKQNLESKSEVLFLEDLSIEDELLFDEKTKAKYLNSMSHINEIYLDSNQIKDLQFIKDMRRLVVVHLNYNQIWEMNCLNALTEIKELLLEYNEIEDISGLQNAKKLTELNLNHNFIETTQGLQNCVKLKELQLADNNIRKIEHFENLKNLRTLDLSYNNLQKIECLQSLTELKSLDLSDNFLTAMENLDKNTKLKDLKLSNNMITKIQNLDSLQELRHLDLHQNKIWKVEGLTRVKNLTYLNLSTNQIKSVKEGLEHLNKLVELNLSMNEICTLEEIIGNNFESLRILNLSYNGLKYVMDELWKVVPNLTQLFISANPFRREKEQKRIYERLKKYLAKKDNYRLFVKVFEDDQAEDDTEHIQEEHALSRDPTQQSIPANEAQQQEQQETPRVAFGQYEQE